MLINLRRSLRWYSDKMPIYWSVGARLHLLSSSIQLLIENQILAWHRIHSRLCFFIVHFEIVLCVEYYACAIVIVFVLCLLRVIRCVWVIVCVSHVSLFRYLFHFAVFSLNWTKKNDARHSFIATSCPFGSRSVQFCLLLLPNVYTHVYTINKTSIPPSTSNKKSIACKER